MGECPRGSGESLEDARKGKFTRVVFNKMGERTKEETDLLGHWYE